MTPRHTGRLLNGERGFTVMELVVGLSLAGLVGTIFFAAWVFTLGFAGRGAAAANAQQMGRIAMATVARELREASSSPGAISVWSTADEAPVDAVGFSSARRDAGEPFRIDVGGGPSWERISYFVHDPSAQVLRHQSQPWQEPLPAPSPQEGRVVGRGIKAVRFARNGDLVVITLQVAVGRGEIIFETAVRPRN